MTKTVELQGYAGRDDHLLHFDGARMQPVIDAVWETIRAEAIKQNPDITDGETRLICGGCMGAFMHCMFEEILKRAEATPELSVRFFAREERYAITRQIVLDPRSDPIDKILAVLAR